MRIKDRLLLLATVSVLLVSVTSYMIVSGNRTIGVTLAGLIGCAVVILAGALVMGHTFARRIRVLQRAAANIGRGDWSTTAPVDSPDELGELAESLNRLAADLKALHAERDEVAIDLVTAREIAEAASRTKGEFLANVTHEVRTPLHGIIGMTELVLDTAVTPIQREHLHTVRRSAEHLLTVINDVLDFSKIEAGKLTVERIDFSLRTLVGDAMQPFLMRADRRCELSADIAPDVPDVRVGDPHRVRQVLTNLIGNAVKFTENGSVVVRVEPTLADRDAVAGLRFSVIDTGIGIPADKLDAVFEAFTQADGSTTRKYGGTGLGLTICRQLVDLMQGRIWVESVPMQGCAFHVELPMPASRGAAAEVGRDRIAPTTSATPLVSRRLRVLVADDNPVNRTITRHLLERRGHVATFATNGLEALDLLQTARFDLVLMDLQMPAVDGLEATASIRDCERTTGVPRVAIVALTAHAMPQDRQRCLDAGMDGFLSKPLRAGELFAEIDRVVPPDASHESGRLDHPQGATA
jgi:signal transduction histidine kinase/ActR/RegA family two-component response regulator